MPNWARLLIASAAAVALAVVAVVAYRTWPRDVVQRVTIDDPRGHWEREGFVEMVPPVRLPSSSAAAKDVAVWLRLPEDAVIETRWSEARGEWVLVFPPGTVADRVEERGKPGARGVVDVRGTRLDEGGEEWMYTLRRARAGVDAPLFGYQWPRSDPEAHARATERLLAELAEQPAAAKMQDAARQRYLDSIRRKNQCVRCHTHERPVNTVEGEHGLVNRGTDGSGFFTPQTVLADAVVLERYGGFDPNLDDPAIRLRCPEGQAPARARKRERERAVCPERALVLAQIDYEAMDPARLRGLCRARRYLFAHLDEQGRQLFEHALAPCTARGW